jgi:lipopolysaccharide transport system permease protein
VMNPVFTMVVFTIFFGNFAKIPSGGVPYPIFSYAGLLPWTLFATALNQSSNSLVGNTNLFTKIYFPRLTLPLSAVITAVVDYLVALTVLFGLMAWYGIWPSWNAIFVVPAMLLVALVAALGAGLWLSALNVRYRDVQFLLPFVVQLWFFATPVVYPTSIIPHKWRTILALNPMSGVVTEIRHAMIGLPGASIRVIVLSSVAAVVMLASGLIHFRRMERTFADIV